MDPHLQPADEEPGWCYIQEHRRGSHRTFSGNIQHIPGIAGDHLRGQLAAVTEDLLRWAAQHSREDTRPHDDL